MIAVTRVAVWYGQLDFSMPERLGAHYIDEQGNKCIPAMIHRAIWAHLSDLLPLCSSIMRGAAVVAGADASGGDVAQAEYATEITKELKKNGLEVNLDL